MNIIGIYKIQSIINSERFYIGSGLNIAKRWHDHLHLLRKNKHHSIKLQNHFNKYGESDLIFIIIEPCLPQFLTIREDSYFHPLPYFNICPKAGSTLGIKPSKETRKLQSIAHIGQTSGMKGKTHSIEANEQNRQKHLGKKSSRKTILKLQKSHEGKRLYRHIPILQFDKQGNFIREWTSASHAGKELLILPGQICNCLGGQRRSYKGYQWKYKNRSTAEYQRKKIA